MTKAQFDEPVFSKSAPKRKIERAFIHRLIAIGDPVKLHAAAVSGQYNEIFPALADEGPVAAQRFDALKPFDYADWAKRAGVKKVASAEPSATASAAAMNSAALRKAALGKAARA